MDEDFQEDFLIDLLGKVHDTLDDLNARYGGAYNPMCLVCETTLWDTVVGIKHYPDCIIVRIREIVL